MKLSTKCRYGARAVMEIARSCDKGPVRRKDIVKNQQISDSYLENILITLKNGGIVETVRGANGGYLLRKPATGITLLEIVNILDGSLAPVDCVDNKTNCEKVERCATRMAWAKMKKAIDDVLGNITVKQLIDYEDGGTSSGYAI